MQRVLASLLVAAALMSCGASPSGDTGQVIDDIVPLGSGEWSDRSVSRRQGEWTVSYDYQGDLEARLGDPDPLFDESVFTEREPRVDLAEDARSAVLGVYVHDATGCEVVGLAPTDPRAPEVYIEFAALCDGD